MLREHQTLNVTSLNTAQGKVPPARMVSERWLEALLQRFWPK